jgi:hypothetical protein
VFSHSKTKVSVTEDFMVGLKVIPISVNRPKHPTSVLTAFQEKETQIYYYQKEKNQKEKNIISKMPNDYYLKYFNGYPLLVKTIKYGK